MRYDYPHVEALLYQWGSWRNRPLRGRGPSGSTWHTMGGDTEKRYWQICGRCLGTKGSGIRKRTEGDEDCPACKGRGGHWQTETLPDPAAIPRTGPGGMQVLVEDTPQEFIDVDAALDSLDEVNANCSRGPRARAVIEARYVHFPRNSARQDPKDEYGQKARVAWVNERIAPDRISGKMYGYLLTTTRRRLADVMGLQTKHGLEQQREVG